MKLLKKDGKLVKKDGKIVVSPNDCGCCGCAGIAALYDAGDLTGTTATTTWPDDSTCNKWCYIHSTPQPFPTHASWSSTYTFVGYFVDDVTRCRIVYEPTSNGQLTLILDSDPTTLPDGTPVAGGQWQFSMTRAGAGSCDGHAKAPHQTGFGTCSVSIVGTSIVASGTSSYNVYSTSPAEETPPYSCTGSMSFSIP